MSIPVPDLSERETSHLNTCALCRALWPFYYRRNERITNPTSWERLCDTFAAMVEEDRKTMFLELCREERKWFRKLQCKINAYQVFQLTKLKPNSKVVSEAENQNMFKINVKAISSEWNAMTPEQKRPFCEESLKLRKQRKAFIQALKPSLRVQYNTYRKTTKSKKYISTPSAFMLYLKHLWQTSRTVEPWKKYHDVMKDASEKWRTLDQDTRTEYLMNAKNLRTHSIA